MECKIRYAIAVTVAFEVNGDSMENGTGQSFQKGDVILTRMLDKNLWMPRLHINSFPFWVINWENNIRLKQIISQEDTIIKCHSLNPSPEYTDFELDLNDVRMLFNVVEVKPKSWMMKDNINFF